MERAGFFNKLALEFSGSALSCPSLGASHDDTDPVAMAACYGGVVAEKITAGHASLEGIYWDAFAAGHMGNAVIDKTLLQGVWHLVDDPSPNRQFEALFRTLAERAALGARLVPPSSSADAAVQAWLHLLKERGSPHYCDAGWIDNLFRASSLMCEQLANDALRVRLCVGSVPDDCRVAPLDAVPLVASARAIAVGDPVSNDGAGVVVPVGIGVDARKRVAGFLNRVLHETGFKVTKTDLWQVAGYRDRTEFQRFQAGNGTKAAIEKFEELLQLDPAAFLLRLEQILPDDERRFRLEALLNRLKLGPDMT